MRIGVTELHRFWEAKREKFEKARNEGIVLIYVSKSRVSVVSPYSQKFVVAAREMSGRWRSRTKQWTFPISGIRLIVEACTDIYGRDKIRIIKQMNKREETNG